MVLLVDRPYMALSRGRIVLQSTSVIVESAAFRAASYSSRGPDKERLVVRDQTFIYLLRSRSDGHTYDWLSVKAKSYVGPKVLKPVHYVPSDDLGVSFLV